MRATVQNIKAFHKYKEEFPTLFADYATWHKEQELRRRNQNFKESIINGTMSISEEGQEEYLLLVKKYLQVTKFPNSDRRVWITTHSGGKHVGFYKDGEWWYRNVYGQAIRETGIVIRWQERTPQEKEHDLLRREQEEIEAHEINNQLDDMMKAAEDTLDEVLMVKRFKEMGKDEDPVFQSLAFLGKASANLSYATTVLRVGNEVPELLKSKLKYIQQQVHNLKEELRNL